MQIKSVRIKSFMAIDDAELHFAAVNKIVGKNSHGKSSVVQAVRYCLQGLVPEYGIDKKNMAPMLARNGGKLFVETVTDAGLYTRSASNKTTAVFGDERLAGVIFDSQAFIEMAPKDRQRLIQQITAADSSDEIAQAAQKHGFSQDVINKILDDMDAAQKWAIDERQAVGRRAKEIETDIAAIPAVEFKSDSGKEVDLSRYTMEQVEANIRKLTARRDELIVVTAAAPGDVEQLREMLDAAKQDLEALSEDKAKDAVEQARQAHATAEKTYREKERELAEAQATGKQLSAKAEAMENKKAGKCPECGQKVTKAMLMQIANEMRVQLDGLAATEKKATKARADAYAAVQKAQSDLAAARHAVESFEERRRNREETIADCNRLIDIETNRATYNDELTEINGKLGSLGRLKMAKAQWDEANKTRPRLEGEREAATKRHEQMDQLDNLLKPDGELRQLANQGEGMTLDAELAEAWDMTDLSLQSDGGITLNGRPIELSGKHSSEKFRAGVLMAEMICRTLDTGVLILDGLEILTKNMAKELSKAVSRWRETFSTIILLSNQDDKPEPSKYEWFKLFWAEDGKVEEVV